MEQCKDCKHFTDSNRGMPGMGWCENVEAMTHPAGIMDGMGCFAPVEITAKREKDAPGEGLEDV